MTLLPPVRDHDATNSCSLQDEQPPLKIALATWAPFLAGAEVAAERLALGLVDAGHDVTVIVGTDGEALARYRDAGLRCDHPRHADPAQGR